MTRFLAVIFLFAASLITTSRSQERYKNDTWNFCVNRPGGWATVHPVDEYAVAFERDHSISMSFGVIKDAENLDDNFRAAYLTDKPVRVIAREATEFRTRKAIVATLAHENPPSKFMHVMTVSVPSAGTIYEFQLTAPSLTMLNKYLPVFNSEVASFKFDCK